MSLDETSAVEITQRGAAELARLIAAGDVSAVDLLRDIGFKNVTSFKGRKAILNPIESVVRIVKNP